VWSARDGNIVRIGRGAQKENVSRAIYSSGDSLRNGCVNLWGRPRLQIVELGELPHDAKGPLSAAVINEPWLDDVVA
jgi:hypothetical protein